MHLGNNGYGKLIERQEMIRIQGRAKQGRARHGVYSYSEVLLARMGNPEKKHQTSCL